MVSPPNLASLNQAKRKVNSLVLILIVVIVVPSLYIFQSALRSDWGQMSDALTMNGDTSDQVPLGGTFSSPSPTPRIPLSQVNARILMYHYVREGVDPTADPIGFNLSITPQMLDDQLTLLSSLGYYPLTMADAAAGKGDKQAVVLTFDDGYADFYTAAYPILKKHGWTATVYIISGKLGDRYMTASQLRELAANGFEIGAHTVNHRNLATSSPTQQDIEIRQSKKQLEQITGQPVTTFAYPSGQYTAETMELVRAAGFTSAVTTHPGIATIYDSAYELPRIRISPRVPLSLLKQELSGSIIFSTPQPSATPSPESSDI